MHTIIYRMGFVLGWLPSEHYVRDIFLITLSAAIAATLLSIRFYLRITAGRCFTEVNHIKTQTQSQSHTQIHIHTQAQSMPIFPFMTWRYFLTQFSYDHIQDSQKTKLYGNFPINGSGDLQKKKRA